MICKRCGTRCPKRETGYCFHCIVATDLEKALSEKAGRPITLAQVGIDEGFPDHSNKRIREGKKGQRWLTVRNARRG